MSGYFTAPSIAWGPSAIEQLAALSARRALVVIDPALASQARTRQAIEELQKAGGVTESLTVAPGEPTVESVETLVEPGRRFGPDWLVAIGGGSTIDATKALWVRLAAPDVPLASVTPLVELGLRARIRLVVLPTTGGSGAEATWTADLRTAERAPVDLSSRELTPDWAVVDPTFLASLPIAIRASTGAEAIAHALEAAVSEWANPFSDALASHALAAALPAIGKLTKSPHEEELAATLQWCATQSGLAMANAQGGVARALARALAAEFGLPYGRLIAALLPYVAEFNHPSARDRYGPLGPAFGPSVAQSRSAVSERLRAAFAGAGLPRTLVDAGLAADRLEGRLREVVDRAYASPGVTANPRVPTKDELRQLVNAAATGAPVVF